MAEELCVHCEEWHDIDDMEFCYECNHYVCKDCMETDDAGNTLCPGCFTVWKKQEEYMVASPKKKSSIDDFVIQKVAGNDDLIKIFKKGKFLGYIGTPSEYGKRFEEYKDFRWAKGFSSLGPGSNADPSVDRSTLYLRGPGGISGNVKVVESDEEVSYSAPGKGVMVAIAGAVGAVGVALLYFLSRPVAGTEVTSTVANQSAQQALSEVGQSEQQTTTVNLGMGNKARVVGQRVTTALGNGTCVCISGNVVVNRLDSGPWMYSIEGMAGLADTGAKNLDDLDAMMCQWKAQHMLSEEQRQSFIKCLRITESYQC